MTTGDLLDKRASTILDDLRRKGKAINEGSLLAASQAIFSLPYMEHREVAQRALQLSVPPRATEPEAPQAPDPPRVVLTAKQTRGLATQIYQERPDATAREVYAEVSKRGRPSCSLESFQNGVATAIRKKLGISARSGKQSHKNGIVIRGPSGLVERIRRGETPAQVATIAAEAVGAGLTDAEAAEVRGAAEARIELLRNGHEAALPAPASSTPAEEDPRPSNEFELRVPGATLRASEQPAGEWELDFQGTISGALFRMIVSGLVGRMVDAPGAPGERIAEALSR